jgi:catabolite regulation protein CreA
MSEKLQKDQEDQNDETQEPEKNSGVDGGVDGAAADPSPIDKSSRKIELRLGDIIEIDAPSNRDIHQNTYYITYIDHAKIRLVNVADAKAHTLYVSETTRQFTDESIQKIRILSRSDELGFARQNGLLPKTWVDVHFGGEIPATITGEITNLDEDQIEITTFPDLEVLYIDFEYKGIPEHIPIQQIVLRRKPTALKGVQSIKALQGIEPGEDLAETLRDAESDKAAIEFSPEGESTVYIPEGAEPDENVRKDLHRQYTEHPVDIIFGEELDAIEHLVEIPEHQQRYGLEIQVNSLIDGLLAKIPNTERTYQVQAAVHNKIERFKQLREEYSLFDKNGDIRDIRTLPSYYKPLLDNLETLTDIPKWIAPVSTLQKKLYNVEIPTDDPDTFFLNIHEELTQQQDIRDNTYYMNHSKPEELKYETMHRQMNPFMTPFTTPQNAAHALMVAPIQSNIEAIVENDTGFKSTAINGTYTQKTASTTRYVIQRYNLGMPNIRQNISQVGKKSYVRSQMTPNDPIAIKGFVFSPRPVIQYYSIETPQTSIMRRANLHLAAGAGPMHSRIFRHADFVPHVVDDLSKDLEAADEGAFRFDAGADAEANPKNPSMTNRDKYADNWLNTFKEYSVHEDVLIQDRTTYHEFLKVILPRTRTLIRAMQPYLKNNLSLHAFVKQLEVFGIHSKDITYKQFNDIRYFLKEHIKAVKQAFYEQETHFKVLRDYKSRETLKPPKVLAVFQEKRDTYEYLTNAYKIAQGQINESLFNAEILQDIFLYDNAEVYTTILSTMMISLMTPDSLMAVTQMAQKGEVADMDEPSRIRPRDCARRYVAKKYTSIRDLQRDNQSDDVFYDTEYDETPYAIIKKYAADQKRLSAEDFKPFLEETLKYKHDCPAEMADEMARTMIEGKKRVQDGEFAILEIRPQLAGDISSLDSSTKDAVEREAAARVKYQYYVRRKRMWVLDPDITEESLLDTRDFFCNMREDCLANQRAKTCETTQDAAQRMRKMAEKRSTAEFDRRYSVSIDDLQKSLEIRLIKRLKSLNKRRILQEIAEQRHDVLAREIGRQIVVEDILASPHKPLFDLIQGQDDFVKKQVDIVRFVDRFCRDPMPQELGESERWKYCRDTNTPLVPMTLYDLAHVFTIGGDYAELQRELAKTYGVLSDDGDAIVDRYTGAVIRKIDFVGENTLFDTDAETLGAFLGTTQTNEGIVNPKATRVFENETTETVHLIFTALVKNLDIPKTTVQAIEDFVLRLSLEIVKKQVMSEEKYTAAARQMEEKKGKKMPPFAQYRGENLILIVAAMTLVAIQGATPAVKSAKTYPGCYQSFTGYPFDGVQDDTALKYIVCVLHRMKSSISVWASIQKLNQDKLLAHIRPIIDRHVIGQPEVQDLFDRKREYLQLHPEIFVPLEHSIKRWHTFLPPVVPFAVKSTVRHLAHGFSEEINAAIRNSNRAQRTLIDTVTCKSFAYSYSVIEAINDVVKRKDAVLKTSGGVPFLENACCNEPGAPQYPIQYFIQDDGKIREYIETVREYSKLSKTAKSLTTADILYHPYPTGIRSPVLPTEYTEENLYQTFIHYLNFDRGLPVPEAYRGLCAECPAGYDPNASILEKIAFLKQNGRAFTAKSLQQLMVLVGRKNRVEIAAATPIAPTDFTKDILAAIKQGHTGVLSDTFVDLTTAVLDAYNPNVMKDADTPEIEALKNYLAVSNSELFGRFMRFVYKNGNISDRKYQTLYDFLANIHEWSGASDPGTGPAATTSASCLKQRLQFIENTLYDIAHVFPNIVINDVAFTNVPKHWGLSILHGLDVARFVGAQHASLNKFKQDKVLTNILAKVCHALTDVYTFLKNFPVVEPIPRGDTVFYGLLDARGMNYLYVHVLYSALAYYIESTSDIRVIQSDIQSTRDKRREMNNTLSDRSAEYSTTAAPEADLVDLAAEELEYDVGLQEIQIVVGNQQDLEMRMCAFLIAMVELKRENKTVINMNYADIMSKSRRTKDREKRKIIQQLEQMTMEERNVENTLKNLRLGKWNVGQQKGLFKYDQETYDRERLEMALDLMADIELGAWGEDEGAAAEGVEVADLEQMERDEDLREIRGEEVDFSMFGEEYTEGAYYEEDREDYD